MMIRKKDNTQPGRRKERSSDSTKENGNHTEETQHGPSQSPPSIGEGAKKWKEIEQTNTLEPKGDEGSVMVFHVH